MNVFENIGDSFHKELFTKSDVLLFSSLSLLFPLKECSGESTGKKKKKKRQ